ncbi:hypothetical protein LNAOJCKE_0961 [Methylorubrum aminovorans]|uniref:Methyltransferase domain-containing protein n=1 Tax=Methylorubrum aminovorans TaxID=269069 RepID=A0ABQ4U8Y0_9HYPH|nr:hypothetical protein [Methylorubrum aminovorans]GJE63763.1 hypothetical protein LNAOJCKE_0961 [Methylorubrum aminovorans]GMA73604.1 hypothetical protein GCM10025880_00210 [Methylorubrum aminovorans]GMA73692.1 hypothetical protein GCM10025880_01090 [Methylorubrum aminovorans]
MPGSSTYGKFPLVASIAALSKERPVRQILDVGPGVGTYHDLIKPFIPGAEFTALEIWGPYVTEYKLKDKYQRVVVGDARYVDFGLLPKLDLAIFGDILEHMTFAEGTALLNRLLDHCDVIVTSVPTHHAPQAEHYGNPWETHVEEDYTEADMRANFPHLVDYIQDGYIGVAFISRNPDTAAAVRRAVSVGRYIAKKDVAEKGEVEDFNYTVLTDRLASALK